MVERMITIEVAYAVPEQQVLITLEMPEGVTAEQAVKASGLLSQFPEIQGRELAVGIFGAVCKPEQVLVQADRVEIYRPLVHDPKEARRHRAVKS